jgi:RNA polymerase sigma factor (sigma-70 family)
MSAAAGRAVEAVWRIERARLLGGLVRIVRDLDQAEELAQEALVAALEAWPRTGIPANPGAWLMATARNRAIDGLRRRQLLQRKHAEIGREQAIDGEGRDPDPAAALDDDIGDDVLRLMFAACHPVLSPEAQAALTLRLVAGLPTAAIARAFLVPEPTMAQRLVRAKRVLAEAHVPFEVPRGADRRPRVAAVQAVLYLVFNEGYAASAGPSWARPDLCHEALRLGRILARLVPDEPEVWGFVALMELQASRLPARTGPDGAPVLLLDQDRRRWDRLLIRRGFSALARADAFGRGYGPYALQAAIAACHARAATAEATEWPRIAALYDALAALAPSPVVELNRAVAWGLAFGAGTGLAMVEALARDPALRRYHLLPAARGELLARLGRRGEASAAFAEAAALTENLAERRQLLRRSGNLVGMPP